MLKGSRVKISFSASAAALLQSLAGKLQPPGTPEADTTAERIYTCIRSVEQASNRISTWSLSVVGATFLAIFGKEYERIEAGRLIYLLFIPAWIAIGISLYHAKKVLGFTLGAELWRNNTDTLVRNFMDCNRHYGQQLRFFNIGLLVLGIWLLAFLALWVFDFNIITDFSKRFRHA